MTIYYGKDSMWWHGEEGLTPLQYPATEVSDQR
jgi:hypothetical protein